ncbi:MAG TPA: galactonate dehydratase [Candidatus Latescibacteria bacterium]|jgi:galactonate dehydratase|nr:galactonate dehydratase [Candidatus Latescibacterota bacterium]|tara:strand:+ start:1704 stop:2831 length:1128 start_codon:yes stop_codon:yes gene_type:complete
MKITDIDTLMYNSPGRKWTVVRVHTDAGITGLGEATYSNKEPVVCAAVEHMKQELIGEDPARIEWLWHHIYRRSSVSGIWRMAGPVWMSALAGIDIALWDLKGKVAGLPVYDLLGGAFRRQVDVYTHFGGSTPQDSAKMAKTKQEEGFFALKGGASSRDHNGLDWDTYLDDGHPDKTVAHFEAVREAVGPDVKLFIDCHGRFTIANSIRLAKRLEHLDLFAYEDPVAPDDLTAYPKIRSQINIPVMGSERLNTKSQFRRLLELEGIDIAQPDLMYSGGITEARKIAAIAETFHVPISFHNTKGPIGILAAAHVMASIPNAAPIEFVTGIDWRDEIIDVPIDVQGGRIVLSERPGLGVELTEAGMAKHRWLAGEPR